MKTFLGAVALVLVLAGLPAAAASWLDAGIAAFHPVSQPQKGQQGQHKDGGRREFRRERQPEREERPRGRLTDEERRELHRDLDKADRELYRRRMERR